jgi:hypothetical protein
MELLWDAFSGGSGGSLSVAARCPITLTYFTSKPRTPPNSFDFSTHHSLQNFVFIQKWSKIIEKKTQIVMSDFYLLLTR